MGTAWTYDKDIDEEHVAIRTKAGLMDVSGLKKVHLVGPHAAHVIDLATTRDVQRGSIPFSVLDHAAEGQGRSNPLKRSDQ